MTDETKPTDLVEGFIRDRNARAASKVSPLDVPIPSAARTSKQAAGNEAPTMSEVMGAAVFDEDEYIEARSAEAAARPNPLAGA